MSGEVRILSTVYPFGVVSTSSAVANVWAGIAEDETDNTCARFVGRAAAEAIWKITGDPVLYIPVCERLLLDTECWFRRYVVELLEEIGDPAALPALQGRAARAIGRIEGGLE